MNYLKNSPLAVLIIAVLIFSCKKTDVTPVTTTITTDLTIYKKLYGATSVAVDGDYIVIKSNGIPDHKSPYFKGTTFESTMYEAYNGTNSKFAQNPSTIVSQTLTFKIPANPKEATTKSATPLGPIGVSLNGIAFFNQYAGQGAPLKDEINSFDQYNGHPQMQGQYHYHVEPTYLTQLKGKDALLGFLLDGFPVYGPLENGKTLTDSDLDVYHGHTGITTEYPNGIYHYHTTADAPYINGSGFFGTAGTVSQ